MNMLERLILKYPDKPWNWKGISENPNLTMEMIDDSSKNYDRFHLWDWEKISYYSSMKMINDHPGKPWDWGYISANPNLTIEMINNHLDKPWDWCDISANPNIVMKMINDHPDKPWDWCAISENPNITMEMIIDNIDKPWDWDAISCNPNLTMKMIDDHPDKPWDWEEISCIPNLTMEMIDDHPDKPWDWNYISRNTFNCKKRESVKIIEKWWLSHKHKTKRNCAAWKIQEWWYRDGSGYKKTENVIGEFVKSVT